MDNQYNPYLGWLKMKIECEGDGCSYHLLARILFDREFYWTVPNDDNREMDGLELRNEYGGVDGVPRGAARVLEVLVALAERMAWQIDNRPSEETASELFWEMVDNLELTEYSDDCLDDEDILIIHEKLNIWLDRRFQPNGVGGIFPLEERSFDYANERYFDERKVEIWYQMFHYIDENFEIE